VWLDAEIDRKNRLSHRSYDTGISHMLDGKIQSKSLSNPEVRNCIASIGLCLNDMIFVFSMCLGKSFVETSTSE